MSHENTVQAPTATLAFKASANVAQAYSVLLHTEQSPELGEWRAYLEFVEGAMAAAQRPLNVFVATDGGAPNAAQRKALADLLARGTGDAMTHVFTNSAFIVGVVTAFRWITRARASAHLPADFRGVCESRGVSPNAVLADMLDTQKLLRPVRIVRQIEQILSKSEHRLAV